MRMLCTFFAGLVFGLGLIVSGMANPAKVTGFLDLAGAWDPSLMLVMAGAIGVAAPAFHFLRRRQRTLLGDVLALPDATVIDRPLVYGSLAFGVGWGMSGFCPGPAVVAFGAGYWKAAVFVLAMLAGMQVYDRWVERAKS